MIVHSDKTIKELQREFNEEFPYLMLEFESDSKNEKLVNKIYKKNMSDTQSDDSNIVITGDTIVFNMIEDFNKKYGLNVHVRRKSGSIWLETTVTNNWTLSMQNMQGEIISKSLDKK